MIGWVFEMGLLLGYIFGMVIMVVLSLLAYWRGNASFWMITAGVSLMMGLYSPRALYSLGPDTFGVGIGLLIIMYAFVCIGFAYAEIFKEDEN
jgi:hypothetical protein